MMAGILFIDGDDAILSRGQGCPRSQTALSVKMVKQVITHCGKTSDRMVEELNIKCARRRRASLVVTWRASV